MLLGVALPLRSLGSLGEPPGKVAEPRCWRDTAEPCYEAGGVRRDPSAALRQARPDLRNVWFVVGYPGVDTPGSRGV